MTPSIVAFAGSLRSGSFNRLVLRAAVEGARDAGAEVTTLDLREFPVPLYDGDLESSKGIPESVVRLKEILKKHSGFLIASPEYNGSMSGVLKNYLDWVSRPSPEECLDGKIVSLLSASPGGFAGMRGLIALRQSLTAMGCLTLPEQFSLARAHEAFDDQGKFKDPKQQARAAEIGADLAKMLKRMGG